MQISDILILTAAALALRLAPSAWRRWLVFAASVVFLYWLQPGLPVRGLTYWLPTATLFLVVLGWLATVPAEARWKRGKAGADTAENASANAPANAAANSAAAGMLLGVVLLIGLTRYAGGGDWLLSSSPPPLGTLLAGLALAAGAVLGTAWLLRGKEVPAWLPGAGVILLIALLVVLKTPALALLAARGLRQISGQDPALAAALDVRWLGFSYIAFRLLHTLRDRQAERLAEISLRDYIAYVIFFPSVVAGPIDRVERFEKDFQKNPSSPTALLLCRLPPGGEGSISVAADPRVSPGVAPVGGREHAPSSPTLPPGGEGSEELIEAGRRLVMGLVKKFVVADTLALVALSPGNALQVSEPGWMWLLLTLYALQIFFDFSGYTDIAIAIGLILGVKLPENFAAPYLKPNLTQFWNSWHMSLTLWFRAYFFNPFVRWLRGKHVQPTLALLITQVSTMFLIGLWHGVTVNFVLWGLWHGLGMFIQNRWSEATRGWFAARSFSPAARRALALLSTLLTFNFVALGWVFFLLPTPEAAGKVFLTLFGF